MSLNETTETVTTVAPAVKVLPAFREDDTVIEATAKALMERGFTVNGNVAVLTDIGALAKLGLIETVGIAEKPKGEDGKARRGPSASVFRIPRDQFNVALR